MLPASLYYMHLQSKEEQKHTIHSNSVDSNSISGDPSAPYPTRHAPAAWDAARTPADGAAARTCPAWEKEEAPCLCCRGSKRWPKETTRFPCGPTDGEKSRLNPVRTGVVGTGSLVAGVGVVAAKGVRGRVWVWMWVWVWVGWGRECGRGVCWEKRLRNRSEKGKGKGIEMC